MMMLQTEGEVDAFYVVQRMKTVRPEFFSSQVFTHFTFFSEFEASFVSNDWH